MSTIFSAVPEAKSELGKPRFLSPTAAVKVSPLCLGAMSIGEAWSDWMGSMNKEQSFKLLDAFYEKGGNFIDTANNYQDNDSENWLGEWMVERGNRDHLVIATKYTTNYKAIDMGKTPHSVNYGGNGKKSLHVSFRDSLKKLQTDYVDILYVHWWEYAASVKEIMDALHELVAQGKVLYLGVSDTPAWVVSAANEYANAAHKTPFSIYQGRWNVLIRDFERDILPMARTYGMALAPWDVMGGGKLQTKKQLEERKKANEGLRSFHGADQSPEQEKMSATLEKIAGQIGVESIQAVALAYVMQKAPYVFPIIGGRKVEHLEDNIKSLAIHLSDDHIKEIEGVVAFDTGFPHNMVGPDPRTVPAEQATMVKMQTYNLQWQLDGKPIGHE
ncbi:aryl-alcohol dehydrogenase AAD14 [Microthyrium microscopicum]|uniref:Aryl-alcohol dehydrogenase AAD14 n=1 Tax=Microthyrium microscopicum TaxID=703497 RepID=A0A6A6TZT8_9PEZI|nr:aryl-alcohol dehydrogenase AAD14 [Microthyrium microscopicum]